MNLFFTGSQQAAILEDLLADVPLEFHFLFSRSHAEVISGKQEGERTQHQTTRLQPFPPPPPHLCLLPPVACCRGDPAGVYAWIGINFVLGRFDHAAEGE